MRRHAFALGVAVSFLTRLPVPAACHHPSTADLRRATIWFPFVGALVGAITALVVLAAGLVWPPWVAVALALAVEARLTGAFHEDAVGDAFDAFGGGTTRERVLEILKDSRLGSYGVLAIVLAVLLRATSTVHLPPERLVAAVVAAAALGRWAGVALLALAPTVAERASLSRDLLGTGWREVAAGAGFALAALFGLFWHAPFAAVGALFVSLALIAWATRYVKRRLGGATGDALGALTYAVQVATLLCAVARLPQGT